MQRFRHVWILTRFLYRMTNSLLEMISAAQSARVAAYAPYSGSLWERRCLPAPAGFLAADVENISFGLTLCAERVCTGMAIAAGERQFEHLVIVAESSEPLVPGGACLQVLAEFSSDLTMTLRAATDGAQQHFRLRDLLPLPAPGLDLARRT